MTSTLPLKLYTLILPSGDSFTVTRFGVGAWPAVQFRFDVVGRGAFAGKRRRFDGAVGFTIVTFMATATASAGMPTQLPTLPVTCCVIVTPGPIGVFVPPAGGSAGRVSNRRHGVTGTKVESVSPGAAVALHA
jgi:hypothetical protein